ncbi:MAG: tRNA pseudouridine(38-40) synthase TruA [Pseudomonadota bacterium]
MPRYRLTIEYDGAPYSGWQRQNHAPSVQGALEEAIFKFCGERVIVQGSGRTDAGVHATGQIAHVDLEMPRDPFKITSAVNFHLEGETVAVLDTEQVDDAFHARFSAIRRHYLYRIIARRPPLRLEANRAWNVKLSLDHDAMHKAAQRFIGEHDFTTFRSSECQAASPIKTLDQLDVTTRQSAFGGEVIEICAVARSFLYNQIRSFAGSLKLVGEGRWSADDLEAALHAKDRSRCGPVAPPQGLYLTRVDYDRPA